MMYCKVELVQNVQDEHQDWLSWESQNMVCVIDGPGELSEDNYKQKVSKDWLRPA